MGASFKEKYPDLTLKNILIAIPVCIVVMVIMYKVVYFVFPTKSLDPDNTWVNGIGEVTRIGYGRHGTGHFEYQYNGKYYRDNSTNSFATIPGEMYPIKINPKAPEEYVCTYWSPTFLPNEKTAFCEGVINRTIYTWRLPDSRKGAHPYEIEYKYSVDGSSFERTQSLPPEWPDEKGERIKEGEVYVVEYLIRNPQIGKLHWDSSGIK